MHAMVGPAVRALFTGDVVLGTGLVAILCKYYKTKWAKARIGSVVKETAGNTSIRASLATPISCFGFDKSLVQSHPFVSTYLLIFVESLEKLK
jgi:hypothetical protein